MLVLQINASVHAFFVAMALNPDVQKKAQAELDVVVGTSRLPQFSDSKSLPYVNALVREVLRWHIVAPIGVPHRSMNDDEYNGYFIPSGSIVIVNAWYVVHLIIVVSMRSLSLLGIQGNL